MHTLHTLYTTLTPTQEAVVVELPCLPLLLLDDLVAVVKAFIEPKTSRSGVHRCLTWHGVSDLRTPRDAAIGPKHKPFKAYEPGYIHIEPASAADAGRDQAPRLVHSHRPGHTLGVRCD